MANETVGGESLIDALRAPAAEGEIEVTVLSPVNPPRQGYVVYEDTRRASARRRLDRTLKRLREAGIAAHGLVVECDPADAVRDPLAPARAAADEIIVSTHPLQKSGWLRRNALDRIRSVAGDIPVEHVVVEKTAGGEKNVLVIANETVVGEALLDRIRERATESPASFLLISPQSDPSQGPHPEAERRLRAALAELRAGGHRRPRPGRAPGPVHGGAAGDRRRAGGRDHRLDVPRRAAGLAAPRPRRPAAQGRRRPVEHVVVEPEPVAGAYERAAARRHHGPPVANQSSRVNAATLGMLLFIASEIMVFGVVLHGLLLHPRGQRHAWPPAGDELPVLRRRRQHRDPRDLELHDALGHAVDQARQPRRPAGGMVLTLALGLCFLLTQAREYSRIGFAPHDNAFGHGLLRADRTPRGARVHRPDTADDGDHPVFRGHFSPEHHHGVEIPGIYWHFVDVMWIIVYTTVYIL